MPEKRALAVTSHGKCPKMAGLGMGAADNTCPKMSLFAHFRDRTFIGINRGPQLLCLGDSKIWCTVVMYDGSKKILNFVRPSLEFASAVAPSQGGAQQPQIQSRAVMETNEGLVKYS